MDLWHTFSLSLYFNSLFSTLVGGTPSFSLTGKSRQRQRSCVAGAQRAEVGKAGRNLSTAHLRLVIAREPKLPIVRYSERNEAHTCVASGSVN